MPAAGISGSLEYSEDGSKKSRAVAERSKKWREFPPPPPAPESIEAAQARFAEEASQPATVDEQLLLLSQATSRNVRSLNQSSKVRLLTVAEVEEAELLAGVLTKLSREQRQRGEDEPQDLSKLTREELEKKAKGR